MATNDNLIPGWLLTLGTVVIGSVMFIVFAVPNAHLPPVWGNFAGAAAVAVGGGLGAVAAFNKRAEQLAPIGWAFVVCGGAAIAGASLQMALG